ncbi:DoxX family protein [Natronosporangium hydrolyticum]|uniref:DoxX family protein n=2 Tax=Natronosporangium hydrolyticum TaxID=2811111 RepID=A0A895YGW0_9ACTN|nr:DoxX family protein [Natronosporangium hydrolyticum]
MYIAYIVTAVLLSALLAFTARNKLVREKEVTAILTRLGVPDRMFPVLATLQLLGAAGLLIGIFFRPLGIAAAAGVVLFFAGAVIAHLRANDAKGTPVPAVLTAFSVVPLALGAATL